MNDVLKDLFNDALKEIMAVVHAEGGSLFLFDANTKELVLDSFHTSGSLRLQGLRKRLGEGISGKVVDIKTPILVKNIDMDSRFKRNGFNHYRTNSFISVPLISSKGLLLGLINITDKYNEESFTDKDLEFAAVLCKMALRLADNILNLDRYASVGKLAAGVVHEINNPLDGVLRYTNMLLKSVNNNSVLREYLLEVKKGLDRIANITRSLVEFSHQLNSNSSKVKRYVNICGIVDDALDIFKHRLSGNIKINKRFDASSTQVLDLGISHIVINIIKNALDAMPDGGMLDIDIDRQDEGLRINFSDTGCGIPDELKNRIFEPFFTTKDTDKGSGLGLAICRELINRYEGEIEVKSSECKKGVTFSVLIPKRYLQDG